MPLDPAVRVFLHHIDSSGGLEMHMLTPEQLRESFALLGSLSASTDDPMATEDRTVPGPEGPVPVRIYRPEAGGTLPLVVYFHGGGFVIGSVATHDGLCRRIAAGVPAVVVSVDYRLAPEHPFPAAVLDSVAATEWAAAHASALGADAGRVAVAGDSAGGNLAAVVSVKARDRGGPQIAFQLLIYPVTDMTASMPSHQQNGEGYLLTNEAMKWFSLHYMGERDLRNPDASPLFVEDLSDLPPTLVVTAEFDPLRDEGEAYAKRLEEAGVSARAQRYDGMIHGFLQFDGIIPGAAGALSDVVVALREALAPATV
jgi:acetyl esterase